VKSSSTLIGPLLQGFFVEHLAQQKHVSPQTIASYRDAFRLLLQYAHKRLKTEPASLDVTALDAPLILSFLDSLETDRHNCYPIAQHSPCRYPVLLSRLTLQGSRNCRHRNADTGYSRQANCATAYLALHARRD
jgi:hypothetical protein